ncbi:MULTISPECIES: hypothetical protein [Actinomycetes]|uniref:hypothetical protein n=1 Tax=Actinomycetes TaxID=1760 RepID=UPI0004C23730|nr:MULTISPECIES: hypothetical protein [Actinomycetes]
MSTTTATTGVDAVPAGDEWMGDRFGHNGYPYATQAHRSAQAATLKTSKARTSAAEKIEVDDGALEIESYVEEVGAIGIDVVDDSPDLEMPLGDALPAGITPQEARRLAATLIAAQPRLDELRALLERRATEQSP